MKKTLFYLFGSFVLFVYILTIIGSEDIVNTVSSFDSSILVLVFTVAILWSLIDCFKWAILVSLVKDKVSFIRIIPIYFSGEFFNALTPGAKTGGEVIKAHYTSKQFKISQSKVYATLLFDKSIYMAVFSVLLACAMGYTTIFLQMPTSITWMLKVFIGFISILSILIIVVNYKYGARKHELFFSFLDFIYNLRFFKFIRKKFETYKIFEEFIIGTFSEFVESLKFLFEHKKGVLSNIMFSAMMFILSFLRVWIIFYGLGYEISFVIIMVVVTLGAAISYMVFTPGGAGVTEVALISFYLSVGVGADVAAIVTIVDRGIYYFISFGVGYVANVYMRFKKF